MNSQVAPRIIPDPTTDPYRTFGIVSLVLAFLMPYLGLVLGIIAFKASANEGHENSAARWGAGIGGVFTLCILVFGVSAWLGYFN